MKDNDATRALELFNASFKGLKGDENYYVLSPNAVNKITAALQELSLKKNIYPTGVEKALYAVENCFIFDGKGNCSHLSKELPTGAYETIRTALLKSAQADEAIEAFCKTWLHCGMEEAKTLHAKLWAKNQAIKEDGADYETLKAQVDGLIEIVTAIRDTATGDSVTITAIKEAAREQLKQFSATEI